MNTQRKKSANSSAPGVVSKGLAIVDDVADFFVSPFNGPSSPDDSDSNDDELFDVLETIAHPLSDS